MASNFLKIGSSSENEFLLIEGQLRYVLVERNLCVILYLRFSYCEKLVYLPSEREDDVVGVMWSLSINTFKESLGKQLIRGMTENGNTARENK